MNINYDVMKEYQNELEQLLEYLPIIIRIDIIDLEKYYNNLKEHNLYDVIRDQEYQVRLNFKQSNDTLTFMYEELAKWCHENPKYMKFIL